MSIYYEVQGVYIWDDDLVISICTYSDNNGSAEYVSVPVKDILKKLDMEKDANEDKLKRYKKALNTIAGLKGDWLQNAPKIAEKAIDKE